MPLTTVRSSARSSSRASATARQLRDDQCHNHDAGAVVFRPLEHDPEKWVPVFPRDKREAFARRSCSNKKIERNDDSKKSHPALSRENWRAALSPPFSCGPSCFAIADRSTCGAPIDNDISIAGARRRKQVDLHRLRRPARRTIEDRGKRAADFLDLLRKWTRVRHRLVPRK